MKFSYSFLQCFFFQSFLRFTLSYRLTLTNLCYYNHKYDQDKIVLYDNKKTYLDGDSIKSTGMLSGFLSLFKNKNSNENLDKTKLLLFEQLQICQPNGINVSLDKRELINNIVIDLESKNPTSKPAYSSKMNGFWRMLYTDFSPPSTSAGKLGPFIGDVYQDLDSNNNIIKNILDLSFPPLTGALIAKQSILNDNTWSIEFDRVGNKLFNTINLPATRFEPGSQIRLWEITYLDTDLRIMRARRPGIIDKPKESFIFILKKELDSNRILIDV